MKSPVLIRKDYLFSGSDAGGQRAACMYTIMETAKMTGVKAAAVLQRRPLATVNWNGPKPSYCAPLKSLLTGMPARSAASMKTFDIAQSSSLSERPAALTRYGVTFRTSACCAYRAAVGAELRAKFFNAGLMVWLASRSKARSFTVSILAISCR
jgi:hypothetical protein